METQSVREMLEAAGAYKRGHFLLSSGLHSDTYIEKFDVLRNPRVTQLVCQGFVETFATADVEVVVGPTTGGILLAFETARQIGCMAAYAERAGDGPGREIRRGTIFTPGTKVLVVDDILTTGGSVRETLGALDTHKVEIVGIGVIMDRSGGETQFGGIPLVALVSEAVTTYDPATCPLCAAGVPLVKPGTTAKPGPR